MLNNSNMLNNKEELIRCLKDLNENFYNVLCLFEKIEVENNIDINDYIIDKYPFRKSFDEVNVDLFDWIENIIDNLNK